MRGRGRCERSVVDDEGAVPVRSPAELRARIRHPAARHRREVNDVLVLVVAVRQLRGEHRLVDDAVRVRGWCHHESVRHRPVVAAAAEFRQEVADGPHRHDVRWTAADVLEGVDARVGHKQPQALLAGRRDAKAPLLVHSARPPFANVDSRGRVGESGKREIAASNKVFVTASFCAGVASLDSQPQRPAGGGPLEARVTHHRGVENCGPQQTRARGPSGRTLSWQASSAPETPG